MLLTIVGCLAQPKSWCRVECVIDAPSNLSIATEQIAPPPLVGGH